MSIQPRRAIRGSLLVVAAALSLVGCSESEDAACLPVPGLSTAELRVRGGGWDLNGRDETEAITKCLDWGYAPETVGDATFEACTRMVRADYCGDGTSWTLDGTFIDIDDPSGLQVATDAPEMQFEAGWGPDGAVCVSASRYEIVGRDESTIVPPCWAALPRCEDRETAYAEGALLTTASLHDVIAACR